MNVVVIAHKNYLKKNDKNSLINIIKDKNADLNVLDSFSRIDEGLARKLIYDINPHKIVWVVGVDIKKPRKSNFDVLDFIYEIAQSNKNIDIVTLFGMRNKNDLEVRNLARNLLNCGYYSMSIGMMQQRQIKDMLLHGNTKEDAEKFCAFLENSDTIGGFGSPVNVVEPKEVSVEETLQKAKEREDEVNSLYERYADAEPVDEDEPSDDIDYGNFDDFEGIEDIEDSEDVVGVEVEEEPEIETPILDKWQSEQAGESNIPTLETGKESEPSNIDEILFVSDDVEEDIFGDNDIIGNAESAPEPINDDVIEMVSDEETQEESGEVIDIIGVDAEPVDEDEPSAPEPMNIGESEVEALELFFDDDDIDGFTEVVKDFNEKAKEETPPIVEATPAVEPPKPEPTPIKETPPESVKAVKEERAEHKEDAPAQKRQPSADKEIVEVASDENNNDKNAVVDVTFEDLSENTNDFSDLSVQNRNAINITEPSAESDLHVWERVTEYERETKQIIGCVTVGVTQLISRTGCTHISIEIGNLLNSSGYDVGVCLMNDETFDNLQNFLGVDADVEGVFEYDGLRYYNARSLYYAQGEHQVVIIDFGTINDEVINEFERARVKIMAVDGSAWNFQTFEHYIMNVSKPYVKSIHYMFNLEGKERYKQLFEPLQNEGYYTHRIGMSESPFEVSKENAEAYFDALDSIINNSNISSNKRKKIGKNRSRKAVGLPFFG